MGSMDRDETIAIEIYQELMDPGNKVLPSPLLNDPPFLILKLQYWKEYSPCTLITPSNEQVKGHVTRPLKRQKNNKALKNSKASLVPGDILAYVIFPFLEATDLVSARTVCSFWNESARSSQTSLWKALVLRKWRFFICVCGGKHDYERIYSKRILKLTPPPVSRIRRGVGKEIKDPELIRLNHKLTLKSRVMCAACSCTKLFLSKAKMKEHFKLKHGKRI
jgi:hypothetical protein